MGFEEKMALATQLTAASPQFQEICRAGAQPEKIARLIREHIDAVNEAALLCRGSPGFSA